MQFSSSWYLPKKISDFLSWNLRRYQLKPDTIQLLKPSFTFAHRTALLFPTKAPKPHQPAPLLLTQIIHMKNWLSHSWQVSYFLQKYSSEAFLSHHPLISQLLQLHLSSTNKSHLGSLASPYTKKIKNTRKKNLLLKHNLPNLYLQGFQFFFFLWLQLLVTTFDIHFTA